MPFYHSPISFVLEVVPLEGAKSHGKGLEVETT
jgi:hypothetical protein